MSHGSGNRSIQPSLIVKPTLLTLLFLAAGIATDAAEPLTLVKDGVSLAPIVVFENAPPLTGEAVEKLAEMMEKISGARPDGSARS